MTMKKSKEVRWVRLGDITQRLRQKCGNADADVSGIDINKSFIDTRANLNDTDISQYYLVPPMYYACNLMHIGRDEKIPIAYNNSDRHKVVTSAYYVFTIAPDKRGSYLPEYVNMFFHLGEFDRRTWFFTDSSVRGNLKENRFLDIEIPVPFKDGVPDVERQKEVVDIWQGLRRLKEENEAIAKPLLDLCQAKIIDLYKYYPKKPIGDFIDFIRDKNSDCAIQLEQGINIQKEFITPQRKNSDLSGRIIVRHGQIAYCSQLNNENVAVAYRDGDDCVVSSVYRVLDLKPEKIDEIDKEYLFLHLCRKEFGRFVYWASIGSAYEFLREQNLCEWEIPIPPIEVQRAIVEIYQCARRAKAIAEEANQQLKSICPALMQYIIHSAV